MRQVVGEESGGVYALSLGEVSVDVVRSRARLTSLTVTTNDSLNGARPSPLPAISGTLRRCRATGIDVVSLVRGRFNASGLGCDDGEVEVGLAEGPPDSTNASDRVIPPFVARLHEIGYGPTAPELRVDTIAFPALRISLRDRRAGGAGPAASLEQLSLRLYGVALGDGAAGAAERRRPLYSDGVEIAARGLDAHLGAIYGIRVDAIHVHTSDSLFSAAGILIDTAATPEDIARARPWRHSLVTLAIARAEAHAMDYAALADGTGLRARRLVVDTLDIEVARTQVLPEDPSPRVRRSPQQFLADLGQDIEIDSFEVRGGRVTYSELHPGRDAPGVITFGRIDAQATNFRHIDGRHTRDDVMRLAVRSWVHDSGRYDAEFIVPLDAPTFDIDYRGTLHSMPVTRLNRLTSQIFPVRVTGGTVTRMTYDIGVRDGVARGQATPVYDGLSISLTETGADGILGSGGVVGDVARGVAGFFARRRFHESNPEGPDAPVRTGDVFYGVRPVETLPSFLWYALRTGIIDAVQR
jgi:hypothetical protein